VTTGINLVGNLASEKGVGEATRCLARAAHAVGLPTALVDFVDTGANNIDAALGATAGHLRGARPYPVTLLSINPDSLELYRSQVDPKWRTQAYTIGYWFWELPTFPAAWQDRFADVDEVLTGSSFAQQAISRTSPIPVNVLPPALVPDPPRGGLTRAALKLDPNAFVVLFVFDAASSLQRKNPFGLIRAFRAAFPGESDVRLVLKSSRLGTSPDRGALLECCQGDPRIVLLDGLLSRPDLSSLIDLCDCYVSLHRAEGFGLTLAEAMLLGKPAIATGWSGNLEFMSSFNSLLVDYRLTRIQDDSGPYTAGQIWADPVEVDAAEKLRWVYRNREIAARLAARGRADVLNLCHPVQVGRRLQERLLASPAARSRPEARSIFRLAAQWVSHDGSYQSPVSVQVNTPDEPGDFELEIRSSTGPEVMHLPVAVTGSPAENFDYLKVYATADLDRDYWTVVGPATRAEYDRLAEVKLNLLQVQGWTPTSRLLDVGCGTGQLAQAVAPRIAQGGLYHGTDLAPQAVEFCRRRYPRSDFSFSVNSSNSLHLSGREFEVVALFSVFTHTTLEETKDLLREIAALLASGGFVFADVFLSPLTRTQTGHRGAIRIHCDAWKKVVDESGFNAVTVQTEPFGLHGTREFFRLRKS